MEYKCEGQINKAHTTWNNIRSSSVRNFYSRLNAEPMRSEFISFSIWRSILELVQATILLFKIARVLILEWVFRCPYRLPKRLPLKTGATPVPCEIFTALGFAVEILMKLEIGTADTVAAAIMPFLVALIDSICMLTLPEVARPDDADAVSNLIFFNSLIVNRVTLLTTARSRPSLIILIATLLFSSKAASLAASSRTIMRWFAICSVDKLHSAHLNFFVLWEQTAEQSTQTVFNAPCTQVRMLSQVGQSLIRPWMQSFALGVFTQHTLQRYLTFEWMQMRAPPFTRSKATENSWF